MKEFMFKSPTKIIFGVKKSLELSGIFEEMKATKIFVVTDKTVETLPPFMEMIEKIKKENYEVQIFSDTIADPPIEVVDDAAKVLKESGADLVVAVGGGSTIDTAKAICMLVHNEGSVKDYLFGGSRVVMNRSLPLICIPTTAGSGSEVTAASVITDNENDIKLSVTHEYLLPIYAVVDPVMQVGMPPVITASTGMDALTHAIEAYVSLNAEPISDALAEKAIALIGENIRTATHEPNNLEARGNMALASVLAAISFANAGLGAVHGIAQSMGGIAHTPHGIANSLLLPYVMEINMAGNLKKFAKIASLLGEKTEGFSIREQAELAIVAVLTMSKDIRIPSTLQEVQITKEMFPEIVKGTMGYRLLPLNPVKIREQDVYQILEQAY